MIISFPMIICFSIFIKRWLLGLALLMFLGIASSEKAGLRDKRRASTSLPTPRPSLSQMSKLDSLKNNLALPILDPTSSSTLSPTMTSLIESPSSLPLPVATVVSSQSLVSSTLSKLEALTATETATALIDDSSSTMITPSIPTTVDVSSSIPVPLVTKKNNITVGAYYYAWHSNGFHNNQGYLRDQLYPKQRPQLGEYDDSERYTIQKHLEFSDVGNINLWVASWWGPERTTDLIIRNTILEQIDKQHHPLKVALFYETTNRLRNRLYGEYTVDQVESDMEYIQREYFDHSDSYYMIDGKPVIFVYLTRKLEKLGMLQRTVELMRNAANQDIYVVGDHAFDPYPTDPLSETAARFNSSIQVLDAITNYDVYGSIVGSSNISYAGEEGIDLYYLKHQKRWKEVAEDLGCAYIPSVKPGFNDRGVRERDNGAPLSRRLTKDSPEGSFFDASLDRAMQLTDKNADNLLLITSFNEWHEDTQIEPVKIDLEDTTVPYDLTGGLAYVGYGTLYLDILRNKTLQYDPTIQYYSSF